TATTSEATLVKAESNGGALIPLAKAEVTATIGYESTVNVDGILSATGMLTVQALSDLDATAVAIANAKGLAGDATAHATMTVGHAAGSLPVAGTHTNLLGGAVLDG